MKNIAVKKQPKYTSVHYRIVRSIHSDNSSTWHIDEDFRTADPYFMESRKIKCADENNAWQLLNTLRMRAAINGLG